MHAHTHTHMYIYIHVQPSTSTYNNKRIGLGKGILVGKSPDTSKKRKPTQKQLKYNAHTSHANICLRCVSKLCSPQCGLIFPAVWAYQETRAKPAPSCTLSPELASSHSTEDFKPRFSLCCWRCLRRAGAHVLLPSPLIRPAVPGAGGESFVQEHYSEKTAQLATAGTDTNGAQLLNTWAKRVEECCILF